MGEARFRLIILLITFIILGVRQWSFSQELQKDVQLWNALVLDYNIESDWLIEVEADFNTLISGGDTWREYATQPSVEHYPNNSWDLFAGAYLSFTKQTSTENTWEIRPLVGFRWNIIKPEKRIFFRTQWKFEYRIFTERSNNSSADEGRLRIRLDLFVPITQKSYNNDKDLYGIIFSEAFINMDDQINERFRKTFRQYLGLGYRLSYSWRFETYYVLQLSRDSISDEDFNNQSNVLFFQVKHYFKKKARN